MTTCLTHDQINDKRQIPILSGETFLESGKLFKRNFQSRNLDTCAASSTQFPNFRVCLHQKSRDTTREIYNPKGELNVKMPTIIHLINKYCTTHSYPIYIYYLTSNIDQGENVSMTSKKY